ncbi:flavin reductase family protein [Nocardia nova]|uniref:flavin reductase family protein n=1 Tax=Nocardia nova TaxID=37330 RepID=UPI0018949B38|nr:flavin reductase family protein [Nocardia nova]MBF6148392.1 flavin reductase family protein [Nocardia nova]MDN2496291.1 flavin reductase family protein [Nocardia nova]
MTITEPDVRAAFKEVMAAVATPVSVVTANLGGLPYGTTVSAFASLSMNPPMVLVSLDRRSETLELVRASGRFGLNILGADQAATAVSFAKKGGADKFHGTHWDLDHDLPRIPGAPGWIACTVSKLVDGGDHVVVLGTVDAAELTDGHPLVYHGRLFGTHRPHGS